MTQTNAWRMNVPSVSFSASDNSSPKPFRLLSSNAPEGGYCDSHDAPPGAENLAQQTKSTQTSIDIQPIRSDNEASMARRRVISSSGYSWRVWSIGMPINALPRGWRYFFAKRMRFVISAEPRADICDFALL
jgi:hypothetical protein